MTPPLSDIPNPAAYLEKLTSVVQLPYQSHVVLRLSAERDIQPEPEQNQDPNLAPNGSGATALIHRVLNHVEHSRNLVSEVMLTELNKIVAPDLRFTNILTRRYQSNEWEVFLEDETGKLIALTHMGSGLKTIILVLTLLLLVPKLKSMNLNNAIFCFEELENHLHPAIQRNLLSYIRSFSLEHECAFFVSTHSSVAIDVFARDQLAQILYVSNKTQDTRVEKVAMYIEHRGVLDDLEIRASDILQANGIIWVEGPSDRIYINRWIEIWSGGTLQEGTHYQVVFYGGRLLSHLTAASPDEKDALVSLLRTNRNAAIVIDSDKRSALARINNTKKRLLAEIESIGGICWITDGKEIENYISSELIARLYSSKINPKLNKFEGIELALNNVLEGEGERYLRGKPAFAEKVVQIFEKDDILLDKHLKNAIEMLCNQICCWNGVVKKA